jgi:ATP-dependent exoDNAse (exonuclease V) beta subunit
MTIHKAKGLGFPVAIVLLYEEVPRGFKYILDEEADGVHLLKINQQIMKASDFLREWYEEERLKDLVNKLNTLYVGFTRAEDELYIVGVQGKKNQPFDGLRGDTERRVELGPKGREKSLSKYQFPIDLLQTVDSQIGSKIESRLCSTEPKQEELKLYHPPDPIRFPFVAVEELNLEERLRGELIHRVLSFIDGLDENTESDLERIITRVNDELKTDLPLDAVKKTLLGFLNHREASPYFQVIAGRVIKMEQEFSDSRGNLFRMDRVILEGDRIFVMDYKTGTDRKAEKEYISQLKNYVQILREIYPNKKVEGVIAYVDLKEIKKV